MHGLRAYLGFRTRGQILGRVVPAYALAAALIAAVAWLGYAQWARQAGAEQQQIVLRAQAVVMAERVAHVAQVGPVAGRWQDGSWRLPPLYDTPANHAILAAWSSDDGHRVARHAHMGCVLRNHAPVWLVRTDGVQAAVMPVDVLTAATGARPWRVLVDTAALGLPDPESVDWWGLIAPDGTVMHVAGRAEPAARTAAEDLGDVSGAYRHRAVGSWWSPDLVGRLHDPRLPLDLVAVTPVNRLLDLALLCFAVVVGIALLAVFAALAGTVRTVDAVSERLAGLGVHMERLARGEYTLRMERGRPDEVGQLIGYFNLMATSLDEAHRQVKDQAASLRVALENQRMLDKSKDDFLVLISHEVRTPLTSVLGGVKFLRTTVENADDADREVLQRLNLVEVAGIVANSGQRLHGFLTDAIQMTTIQSSERRLELAAVPAAELFGALVVAVSPRAADRGISVDNGVGDGWELLCDRSVLDVAVRKIIDNAVAHNPDGGRVVIREVDELPGDDGLSALVTADMVRRLEAQDEWHEWSEEDITWRVIEVHNTGRAIPPDRLKALFGKFELVGRIEHHSRGSGLSLPIAKAAVEEHGGRIAVRSEEGWGTAFYVVLPSVPAGTGARRSVADDYLGEEIAQGVGSGAGDE